MVKATAADKRDYIQQAISYLKDMADFYRNKVASARVSKKKPAPPWSTLPIPTAITARRRGTRSGLRALACVVLPLGLLWCAVSRTRSSLQDIVVRSVVVYDAHPFVTRSG